MGCCGEGVYPKNWTDTEYQLTQQPSTAPESGDHGEEAAESSTDKAAELEGDNPLGT